jgi:hypothetical protein
MRHIYSTTEKVVHPLCEKEPKRQLETAESKTPQQGEGEKRAMTLNYLKNSGFLALKTMVLGSLFHPLCHFKSPPFPAISLVSGGDHE